MGDELNDAQMSKKFSKAKFGKSETSGVILRQKIIVRVLYEDSKWQKFWNFFENLKGVGNDAQMSKYFLYGWVLARARTPGVSRN